MFKKITKEFLEENDINIAEEELERLLKKEFDIIERLMVHMHPNSLMSALFWLEIAKYKLCRFIHKCIKL